MSGRSLVSSEVRSNNAKQPTICSARAGSVEISEEIEFKVLNRKCG